MESLGSPIELNSLVVIVYLIGMLFFGHWGKRRLEDSTDFLLAGRKLGGFVYTSTMVAVLLGGASTVGAVGLGYQVGISGAWIAGSMGIGLILLGIFFAARLRSMNIVTVSDLLAKRYGAKIGRVSGVVMLCYTLMVVATSFGAVSSILIVVIDCPRWVAVVISGFVVVAYASLGGMWSITLADVAQFVFMTIGIFIIMLPLTVQSAGGWSGLYERLGHEFFSLTSIGFWSIATYFAVYALGILIGQDMWQRVFTARTPSIARWGSISAGIYCLWFALAGAVIGMAASLVLPGISSRDEVFASIAMDILPAGLGGFVLAAGLAAMMSTASGSLIAAATVVDVDFFSSSPSSMRVQRQWVLFLGVLTVFIAILVPDVVAALTIAYDLLVGGLLVSIVGGLIWKRGNRQGATCSMIMGLGSTIFSIVWIEIAGEHRLDGVYATEPIYIGLGLSLISYIVGSLVSSSNSDSDDNSERNGHDTADSIPF